MSYSQMQSASTKLNSAVLHNFNFFSYRLYNTKTTDYSTRVHASYSMLSVMHGI